MRADRQFLKNSGGEAWEKTKRRGDSDHFRGITKMVAPEMPERERPSPLAIWEFSTGVGSRETSHLQTLSPSFSP